MTKKIRVGVLFGGKSAEHEISLLSARNVIEAIPKDKYEVVPIGIDKSGQWRLNRDVGFLAETRDPRHVRLGAESERVALAPGKENEQLVSLANHHPDHSIDVIFPVLHGPMGEDGTVQGLLRLANIPFVGAGVLGSAVGMDKDVMKRLLDYGGVPVPKFLVYYSLEEALASIDIIGERLGLPCFVKPANLGSSVGIHKAHDEAEFNRAVADAFQYDHKIIVEEFIACREIECAVLGNQEPIASIPGEVIPSHEFYSYEAKYIDDNGARLEIPARLSPELTTRVQEYAVKAFKILCCEGMARVDCFVRDDQVFINEINTIPGFTRISMYPKLWEASGVSYTELVDRLIQLALERHRRDQNLKTSVTA